MDITKDQMAQITQEIWGAMLNIDLMASDQNGQGAGRRMVGACVQIAGAWEGAVRLDCTQQLAQRAAAAFMGIATEDVSVEQMRDAVGELANMSAGSVKPLLPSPCHLSLPSVVDGTDYQLTIRNGTVTLQSSFAAEGGEYLSVSVVEAERSHGRRPV
jgi:chemotaxis protein CheX